VYAEFFRGRGAVYAQIRQNALSPSSFLYNEPFFLLQKEVSETGNYFSIIKTIAQGNHKLSRISGALEIKQTSLSKYLNVLVNLGFLEREVPVTEGEKSKRGLYRIKDNYLHFWFRFVYPYRHYLETGRTGAAEQGIRNNFIDGHVSYVYEDICREKMWDIDFMEPWGFPIDHCGKWWNGNAEIDIVAYNGAGNEIIFGECKFTREKTGPGVLRELRQKSPLVSWKRENRKEYFVLFSISGYTEELRIETQNSGNIMLL
jgi:AAA+ ATPase superfamily predicted ATPase